MKAAFYELEEWMIPRIREKLQGTGVEVVTTEARWLTPNLLPEIADIEILSIINSPVDDAVLDRLPKLKMIAVASTGYDHVDVEAARRHGVLVCNDPVYSERTVAEYTFALMLAMSRKMRRTVDLVERGVFTKTVTRGFDLGGKTLGVIGTGKIGARVIKFAHAFDMNIVAFSRTRRQDLVDQYEVRYVELDELLAMSDVITVHLPYMPETHHLIDDEKLRKMKKGAVLVNTARGKIVDTAALWQVMQEGLLGGVALDAFEGEEIWIKQKKTIRGEYIPAPEDWKSAIESFALLKHEDSLLTPHIAFNTFEAMERLIEVNLENILLFKGTGKCKYQVS